MSVSVRIAALIVLAAVVSPAADKGEKLYKEALKAEKKGDLVGAFLLYSKAAAASPRNMEYWSRSLALRPRAELAVRSFSELEQSLLGPADEGAADRITARELEEVRQALPPPRLKPVPGLKDFNLNADSKTLFEQVAKEYGYTVVFEADYQPTSPYRFRLFGVTYQEALRTLEDTSNSFIVPISEKVIFVARDNPQKRTEYEPTLAAAIPIPQRMSIQEGQELMTAVQQTFEIRRVALDPQKRLIFMRDRYTKVSAAQLMMADILRMRPQVEVEVDLLSTSRQVALNLGVTTPTQFPLTYLGSFLNSKASIPSGITGMLTFGGGMSLFGVGIQSASMVANMSDSVARTWLHSQIMSLDGQPATLHVGDRYPILTAGYFGATTGTGQVYTPPPTVNFEDLGLVVKITPTVHNAEEISLEIEAEFKLLGSGSFNGIPVISNRKFASKFRLQDGQCALIGGLLTTSDARTIGGLAGLSSVPLLGALLRSNTRNTDNTETLLVITPHITSPSPNEIPTHLLWVGTDTRPRVPL